MRNLIKKWRKFIVGLGYWQATFLHSFVIMPLVLICWWLLIFSVLPKAFGAQFSISPSAFFVGPLLALWVVPSLVLGTLIWPMCRLGLSLETDEAQMAEQD